MFDFGCSGQDPTVTLKRAVVTQKQGSLTRILAFMDCGLTTKTAIIRQTVIPTILSMNPRFPIP